MNTDKYLLTFVIILSSFFLFSAEANAATYYVSPSGSNSNPGTNSQPFKTIQEGVNNLSAGDTLIVKDGTYTNPHGSPKTRTVNVNVSGTSGNWITIKSENKWGAILDGGGNAIDSGFTFNPDIDYVRIEDFEIFDYKGGAISINQEDISNIYIYGNHIHDIGRVNDAGAQMGAIDTNKGDDGTKASAAQYITIDSNIIHDIGKLEASGGGFNFDHALYFRGHHNTVINNIFYNNKSGWDITVGNKGAYADDDLYYYIANNTFYVDNYDWTHGRSGAILIRASSIWVENNIFIVPSDKKGIGGAINVYDRDGCEDNLVFRNNLTNSLSMYVEHDGGSSGVEICIGEPTESGNIENVTNPNDLFFGSSMPSVTDTNYKLKSNSPAIDTGKIPYLPDFGTLTHDYRYTNIRPQNSLYDIGAYEYKSSASQTCASFTYSSYSQCQPDSTQTRTVTSSSPQGCTGGNPITTRTCTYIPPSSNEIIIDNGDQTTSYTGVWNVSSGINPYGQDSLFGTQAGTTYSWQTTLPKQGTYNIDMWWTYYSSRSESVPVAIYNGTELIKSLTVNQQQNGGQWNTLATINFETLSAKVVLTDVSIDGQQSVSADAVRFTLITTLLADLNNDSTVNTLDWSIMNGAWGTSNTTADLNNDGIVNTLDWSIMNSEWGETS